LIDSSFKCTIESKQYLMAVFSVYRWVDWTN